MNPARAAAEAHYRVIAELPPSDEQRERMRALAAYDLYYLLTVILRRRDARNDWVYDRCREFEKAPDGRLDLWYRGSWKTSIISFAAVIQEIIRDREITIGIFSFNRPAAKAILRQLKREMEQNPILHELWPDIFWANPGSEAPTWSEDSGLVVNRKSNPKEATVEAWGLVEGQPVGKHYKLVLYDDVVMQESVTTPEMIQKTTEAVELSLNLIAEGGRRRGAGTRYAYGDTYTTMIEREILTPRVHPVADEDGNPAGHLSLEEIEVRRRNQGVVTFACQMLLRPTADSTTGFREEWLQYYDRYIEAPGYGMNRYIVVDPAHSKKKGSDWTCMWVVGTGEDGNYHICEVVRDRLSLFERIAKLIYLHKKWKPSSVGYERYGMQADVEALRAEQNKLNYRFGVVELAGKLAKADRIARLLDPFERRKFWFPRTVPRTLYDGTTIDLMAYFINHEYLTYPAVRYDDMMDSLSRILDQELGVVFPEPSYAEDRYERAKLRAVRDGGWMAA